MKRAGRMSFHMKPKAASRPEQTHSALFAGPYCKGDVDFSVRVTTVRQLRQGSQPNPHEVGWVLWHYKDNQHFMDLLLKPNGIELGKVDGSQVFLWTDSSVSFQVGKSYKVRVVQIRNTISVWVDNVLLIDRFMDLSQRFSDGRLALYCEDSECSFEIN